MTKYRMSEQNLLTVMNHLPSYGIDVIQVSSVEVNGGLEYTLELNGQIPGPEIAHFNTGGQYLEVI